MSKKAKSHSGAKKRFTTNAKGMVKSKSANHRHNLGDKSPGTKRRRRVEKFTNQAAQKKLRKILGLIG
jgi:large subunit ribosomal protein L35